MMSSEFTLMAPTQAITNTCVCARAHCVHTLHCEVSLSALANITIEVHRVAEKRNGLRFVLSLLTLRHELQCQNVQAGLSLLALLHPA